MRNSPAAAASRLWSFDLLEIPPLATAPRMTWRMRRRVVWAVQLLCPFFDVPKPSHQHLDTNCTRLLCNLICMNDMLYIHAIYVHTLRLVVLLYCNSVKWMFKKNVSTVPQRPSDRRVSIPWSQPSSMPISGPSHRHRFERCTPVKHQWNEWNVGGVFFVNHRQTWEILIFCIFGREMMSW